MTTVRAAPTSWYPQSCGAVLDKSELQTQLMGPKPILIETLEGVTTGNKHRLTNSAQLSAAQVPQQVLETSVFIISGELKSCLKKYTFEVMFQLVL